MVPFKLEHSSAYMLLLGGRIIDNPVVPDGHCKSYNLKKINMDTKNTVCQNYFIYYVRKLQLIANNIQYRFSSSSSRFEKA